jgi:hypothetical protein
MSTLPTTVLPVASLARVLPDLQVLAAPAGLTAHIAGDHGRPACGRRPRGARLLDLDASLPPLRVCARCRGTLTELTRAHLSGLGRPTPAELAAVHEADVRTRCAALAAELERIREDAVFDGSVSEEVHLVEAVADQRGPEHRRETLTFGGHTARAVPMTLGLLIGALKPGARTDSQVWITDPPPLGTPVALPQGDGALAHAMAPPAPGRFSVYTWPQQRLAGGGR